MSDRGHAWEDLREQAEHLGIENTAALTVEQLRSAIDERHRGADPQQARAHATGQQP
ncbi:hypothetical protein [Amycolatopsis anabasis]|uniref:hypothetical protein n=1 Tax=Amycolatopsis anabasis TaxID=1840409 RepID=UPI00131DC3D9|nr:hypothetical protein [Amycolatopsis anabasis]